MKWLPGTFRGRLLLIAASALAVRVVHTLVVGGGSGGPSGDIFYFHSTANLLAEGRGYIGPYTLQNLGLVRASAEHPPLWPFLLAVVSKAGFTSYTAHRLVGCVVGAGVVAALGFLGRRVAGERVGMFAAGIAALYPILVAADGSLMSESLYGLGIALGLFATYRLLERPSYGRAAVLGVAIAFAALVRAEALLLLALLVLPAAWRAPRPRWRLVAVAWAAAALVIAPWTARNWITFDRPVLISLNDSTVLVGANCHATYHGPDLGFWRDDCRTPLRANDEASQAALFRHDGINYALDHVGRLPVVVAVRVLRTWDLYQPLRQVRFAEGRNFWVERAGVAAYFLFMLPLAVYGLVLLRRRGQPLFILLSPMVLVTVTSVLGYGYTRFRHAAEISLVVLAAVGLAALYERRRARVADRAAYAEA